MGAAPVLHRLEPQSGDPSPQDSQVRLRLTGPLASLPAWAWGSVEVAIRDKSDEFARRVPRLPTDPIDDVADALYEMEYEESVEAVGAIVIRALRRVLGCRGIVVAFKDTDGAFRVNASFGLGGRAELLGAVLEISETEAAFAVQGGATYHAVAAHTPTRFDERYGGGTLAWRIPVIAAGQLAVVVEVVEPERLGDEAELATAVTMLREAIGEFVAQHDSL